MTPKDFIPSTVLDEKLPSPFFPLFSHSEQHNESGSSSPSFRGFLFYSPANINWQPTGDLIETGHMKADRSQRSSFFVHPASSRSFPLPAADSEAPGCNLRELTLRVATSYLSPPLGSFRIRQHWISTSPFFLLKT